jgi:hypothetical protein
MAQSIIRSPGILVMTLMLCTMGATARGESKDDLELLTKDLGISLWDESFSVRNGVGYKDNILLDESQPKASPFFVNGLDITILRLPLDRWEFAFFVSGDDIRYWQDVGVGSEDLWLGGMKLKYNFADGWQAGMSAAYSYEGQVLDLLNTEGISTVPTKVIGHTIILHPSLRRDSGENWSLELQLEGTRQIYGAPAFSYWRAGSKLTLARRYGHHSDVSLSYQIIDQPYDSNPQADLNGNGIPGTRLIYLTQRVELASQHYWDKEHVWESTTKLDFDINHDNGSGYFNFYRYAASEQADYENHGWKITGLAELIHYDYPLQDVSSIDTGKLYQTGLTLNLHLEKQLFHWLKLFMEYEYEHAFSNESTEHYIVNTIKGGASWEF